MGERGEEVGSTDGGCIVHGSLVDNYPPRPNKVKQARQAASQPHRLQRSTCTAHPQLSTIQHLHTSVPPTVHSTPHCRRLN